ncbi:MAG: type 4a pilus biogenesis protein PilO [bacterium]
MALNKNQQNIIGGVGLGLICIIFLIWKVYIPLGEEIHKLDKELTDYRQKIESMKAKAQQLDKLKRDRDLLNMEVQESQKQLPKKAEIDDLLRHITDTAQAHGIFVSQFSPAPKAQMNYYTEIPINLQINTTYHDFAKFLVELSLSERIIYARNIKMNKMSDPFTISSSFLLVTFMAK